MARLFASAGFRVGAFSIRIFKRLQQRKKIGISYCYVTVIFNLVNMRNKQEYIICASLGLRIKFKTLHTNLETAIKFFPRCLYPVLAMLIS